MRKALTGGALGAALCLTACTVGDPLEEPAPVDVTTVTENAKPTPESSEPSEAMQPKTPEKREPSGADVTAELTSAVEQVVAAHGGTAAVSMGESTAGDASGFALFRSFRLDAFFPFADGFQILADAGVKAVVQPGGSIRDEEIVAAANEAGVTMYFTGTRHFAH